MSILSDYFKDHDSARALNRIGAWFGKVGTAVATDPGVKAAVATLEDEASQAFHLAAEWGGTALDGALAVLAQEVSASVVKYTGQVTGGKNSDALTAAETAAIQAALAVGVAAVKSALVQVGADKPG